MIYLTYKPKKIQQEVPWQLAKNQTAIIMPLGDIHFGSKDFPAKHLIDNISWALSRGCLFIGLGEYLDFTSESQRKLTGQMRDSSRSHIDDAVRYKADELFEILAPTKGRWIGMIEGDHRWDFLGGTSVDQYLCGLLGCDFLGTSSLIRLSAGIKNHPEADCIFYVHHGIGTSRTSGGNLLQVENLIKTFDADVFLMGHSHAKVGAPIDRQAISPDGVHYHRTKILARTGAWLKGYVSHAPLPLTDPVINSRGTYVEQRAYTPSALGGIVIGVGYEQIPGSKYYKPALHLSL